MEKKYAELESRINELEKDLTEAKLELESSRKGDLLEESLNVISEIDDKELKEDLTELFTRLLSPGSSAEDFGIARTYLESVKEKLELYNDSLEKLNQAKHNLVSIIKIILES